MEIDARAHIVGLTDIWVVLEATAEKRGLLGPSPGHCKCPQVAWKGEPAQETEPGPTWRKKGQQRDRYGSEPRASGGVSFLLRGLAQGAELIPEDGAEGYLRTCGPV